MNFLTRVFPPVCLMIALFFVNGHAQPKITKAFLMGHYDYSKDTSFIKVDNRYSERVIYLQKATYRAYIQMHAAALKEGVELNIISGPRSFEDQCYKWGSKWNDPQFAGINDPNERA